MSWPRFLEPIRPLGCFCLVSLEASVSILKVKKFILAFKSFLYSNSSGFVGVGPEAKSYACRSASSIFKIELVVFSVELFTGF